MIYHGAEPFHPWVYIADEIKARGWSLEKLAARMAKRGDEQKAIIAFHCLNLCRAMASVEDNRCHLGRDMAQGLARAFGTTVSVWLNLDEAWRTHPTIVEKNRTRK